MSKTRNSFLIVWPCNGLVIRIYDGEKGKMLRCGCAGSFFRMAAGSLECLKDKNTKEVDPSCWWEFDSSFD